MALSGPERGDRTRGSPPSLRTREERLWEHLLCSGRAKYADELARLLLFASFDAGGFVSVDKPPLAFWNLTLSAGLFGHNGLSLIVPQALAGIATVVLLYHDKVAKAFFRRAVDETDVTPTWVTTGYPHVQ